MYALIIATGMLGVLLNMIFDQAEQRVLHWHPSQRVWRGGGMTRGESACWRRRSR